MPATKGGHPISNILYIGNIPFGVAEKHINELLCRIEEVASMSFLADRHSIQPRWFGFVEMYSQAEAKKEMKTLNGNILLNSSPNILKRNRGMPKSKLCSFCISQARCKKPEAERNNNCKDYMLKTESENKHNE